VIISCPRGSPYRWNGKLGSGIEPGLDIILILLEREDFHRLPSKSVGEEPLTRSWKELNSIEDAQLKGLSIFGDGEPLRQGRHGRTTSERVGCNRQMA
jgi:hypothetical protein